jgi:hypothetical protein
VTVAGRKKKRTGPFDGAPAVSWDTPADAVPLADVRAVDALVAGMGTPLVGDGGTFDDAARDVGREMLAHIAWSEVPWPPAEDPRNDDKAFGESQVKFDARRPRKKAGPRQRRTGP